MTLVLTSPEHERTLLRKLGLSFFLFGLINNGECQHLYRAGALVDISVVVLYVIILSAALDLVPPSTPKGIIAFCNIAPALVAKVGWPYFLKGRIRYARRVVGCCLLSFFGMLVSSPGLRLSWLVRMMIPSTKVVAFFDSLYMRLLGICLASFSSGTVSAWSANRQKPITRPRIGRINLFATLNDLCSPVCRRTQCWVRILHEICSF